MLIDCFVLIKKQHAAVFFFVDTTNYKDLFKGPIKKVLFKFI